MYLLEPMVFALSMNDFSVFKVGDKVRISSGHFENRTGKIVNIGSDGLVQVKLDLIKQNLIATFMASELEIYVKTHKRI